MKRLIREKQAQIVAALIEGNSIRATSRMFGVSKDTVLKLQVEPGYASADFQDRRFHDLTCLTNAFSKKVENHAAAFALYLMHYNFCRVHQTLRVTPAMEAKITDHIWTIEEMLEAIRMPNGTYENSN